MRTALRSPKWRHWPKALAKLRVSLNITAADLGDPEFAGRFAAMAKTAKIDPDRLTLELTEQAMLSDPASAAEQLAQIRALGVAVAIDDFGTGYSSLSLLARLPIDYLKIDSGFTRTIDGSDRDRIVVRAIVDLARALGAARRGRGIENERQLARLSDLGVATWQGFLKSGPVPADQLLDLLNTQIRCAELVEAPLFLLTVEEERPFDKLGANGNRGGMRMSGHLPRQLPQTLRQLQRAVEPRPRAHPVAADRQFVVGADARAALQPLDIGDQARDVGERVAVEADERALGSDVELGDAGELGVRLDLHQLDEVRGFGGSGPKRSIISAAKASSAGRSCASLRRR